MSGEVLAIENIDYSKEMNKADVDAIKTINNFLGKKNSDDEVMKQIKSTDEAKSEDIRPVKDAYNVVKDKVIFSDAYSDQEYSRYKNILVLYLKKNLGHGINDISETSLYKTNPMMMHAKLLDYNTTDSGITTPINIAKFMTNFQAERIAATIFVSTPGVATQEKQNQNKEHKTGEILNLNDEEKQWIQDKINAAIENPNIDIRILGQANGVKPQNNNEIKKTYTELREQVLRWCTSNIESNLIKIFPDFNDKNFPDAAAWNMGYAMSRTLNILSALDADQKNKIFAWGNTDNVFNINAKQTSASLGKVKFIFKSVETTRDEDTLGNLEIVPTKIEMVKTIKKNIETIIKQINQTGIGFEIAYNGTKQYTGGSTVKKYIAPAISAFEFINKDTDSGKRWASQFAPNASKPDDILNTQYGKHMNIVIPYDKISSYSEFISHDKASGKMSLNSLSFDDALRFYKQVNENNPDAIHYADLTKDMLDNFKYLNEYINNNPDIREELVKSLAADYNGDKHSSTAKFLINLWATLWEGKTVALWNTTYRQRS